jgi:hypothetical protein
MPVDPAVVWVPKMVFSNQADRPFIVASLMTLSSTGEVVYRRRIKVRPGRGGGVGESGAMCLCGYVYPPPTPPPNSPPPPLRYGELRCVVWTGGVQRRNRAQDHGVALGRKLRLS